MFMLIKKCGKVYYLPVIDNKYETILYISAIIFTQHADTVDAKPETI